MSLHKTRCTTEHQKTDAPEEAGADSELRERFHRKAFIKAKYSIGDATVYRWMAEGRFPLSVKLGPGVVAWRDSDLRAFDADPQGWAERHRGAA